MAIEEEGRFFVTICYCYYCLLLLYVIDIYRMDNTKWKVRHASFKHKNVFYILYIVYSTVFNKTMMMV